MSKIGTAVLATLLLQTPAANPTDEAMKLLWRGQYLQAIEGLRAAEKSGDPFAAAVLRQFEPTITGFPQRPSSAASSSTSEHAAGMESVELGDALDEIVRRAKDTRIVMINEAHDTPRHRAFAWEVARALRPLGYTHLAAETFNNNSANLSRLKNDGFVRLSTGSYTIDPVFADFVRQALRLGYQPVAYEEVGPGVNGTRDERIAAREEAQASSLARQIADAGPDAKFLIHVGHAHVEEEPIEAGESTPLWMAARLKQKTGIDPLTIDQTMLDEFSQSRAQREIHAVLASGMKQRSAFATRDGKPLTLGGGQATTDLQIVHPAMRLERGRPTWLRSMGRQAAEVSPSLLPAKGCRLIQAFVREEPDDAIPVDQVMACAGSPAPVLMLPERPVRFRWQSPAEGGPSRE